MSEVLLENSAIINYKELNKRLILENAALRASNQYLLKKTDILGRSEEKFRRWSIGLRLLDVAKSRKLRQHELSAVRKANQNNNFLMKAPAGICLLTGPDLVMELVNPGFQNLFPGLEMRGRPLIEAMPALKEKPLWPILQHVYLTGEAYEGREMMIPKLNEGSGLWENRYFNFIYNARFDEAGKVDGIMVFTFEVTDLVLSKRRIEESELHSGRILDAIHQIAFTMNLNGEVTFVNQRWHEYTGLNLERDKDLVWELTMHPDEMEEMSVKWVSLLSGNTGGEYEYRKRRRDGEFLWHLCCMEPILDQNGKVLMWIGTSTDINEFKKLQFQKDDFINIASHELKTPLTSLKAAIQLLEESSHSISAGMYNNLISRASTSLNKVLALVGDLLNVGQFNHGQLSLDRSWFVLTELMADYCKVLHISGGYIITFTGDLDLSIFADPKRIEQVMINIINNSVKYAPDSRSIQIDLEQGLGEIKISVTDQGPGIQAEVIPRLFDRYYRVEKNGHKKTGLGLGLYICAEIVKKHGGSIHVKTAAGSGSTFWFTLPQ